MSLLKSPYDQTANDVILQGPEAITKNSLQPTIKENQSISPLSYPQKPSKDRGSTS